MVDSTQPGAAQATGGVASSYREELRRADAFLALVAADRGYPHVPLLGPADDPR